MIRFTTGDIFTTDCEAIGHGCNCEGKSGRGIILQVKAKYPKAIREYTKACHEDEFNPGDIQAVKCDDRIIVNLGTQRSIKRGRSGGAKMEYLEECFKKLAENDYGFKSIALPRIGCGLGGLNWGSVRRLLMDTFHTSKLKVVIYE